MLPLAIIILVILALTVLLMRPKEGYTDTSYYYEAAPGARGARMICMPEKTGTASIGIAVGNAAARAAATAARRACGPSMDHSLVNRIVYDTKVKVKNACKTVTKQVIPSVCKKYIVNNKIITRKPRKKPMKPCKPGSFRRGRFCIPKPCLAGRVRVGAKCVPKPCKLKPMPKPWGPIKPKLKPCPPGRYRKGPYCIAKPGVKPKPCPPGRYRKGPYCIAKPGVKPKPCPPGRYRKGPYCIAKPLGPKIGGNCSSLGPKYYKSCCDKKKAQGKYDPSCAKPVGKIGKPASVKPKPCPPGRYRKGPHCIPIAGGAKGSSGGKPKPCPPGRYRKGPHCIPLKARQNPKIPSKPFTPYTGPAKNVPALQDPSRKPCAPGRVRMGPFCV